MSSCSWLAQHPQIRSDLEELTVETIQDSEKAVNEMIKMEKQANANTISSSSGVSVDIMHN